MDRIVIVGSGASGVHFALSVLQKGYDVVMLDVGRAAADFIHLGVAKVALDDAVKGIAPATLELDGGVRRRHVGLGAHQLRDGRIQMGGAAGSELVFDVISASGRTTASTAAKMRRFSARSSVAASSTQSTSAMSA